MDTNKLLQERTDRIMKAIHHEKPDRTPLVLNGSVAMMKHTDPNSTTGMYVRDPISCLNNLIVPALEKLPNIDMLTGAGMWPGATGMAWMCKTKLPGRELPEDALWQLDEQNFMTRDDYDIILDKGWDDYYMDIMVNRMGYDLETLAFSGKCGAETNRVMSELGYPVALYGGGMSQCVVDKLTSARGTVGFFRDMRQIPDKLMAVIDCMMEAECSAVQKSIESCEKGTIFTVTPAIRCTCDYISREMFEKFIWPAQSKTTWMMLDAGMYVFFHNDSNWNDFLDFYQDFPADRCIYDSDGQTDIYKIKEMLGDKMCITGNVSPALLSLGTPDEVYNFCRKQIEDMGPGYILSGSCTLPCNTKPENLDALNAAVAG